MRRYQTLSPLSSVMGASCINLLWMMMMLLIVMKPSTIIASSSSQQQQKKSPLAMRFSIEGPKMTYQDRTINLDYSTRDWVNVELLGYEIYDFECKEPLGKESDEKSENGKEEGNKNIPIGNISQLSLEKAEGTVNEGDKAWRLALEVSESYAGTLFWNGQTKFCVRMMLRNLPITNEHSAEVNFVRSQLDVRLNSKAKITSVQLTKPEDTKIQVLLPFGGGGDGGDGGGGQQAKVHDASKDTANDEL